MKIRNILESISQEREKVSRLQCHTDPPNAAENLQKLSHAVSREAVTVSDARRHA